MVNSLITLIYAGTLFVTALVSITKFRKLMPLLLVLGLTSIPLPKAEIVLASSVTGIVLGYFINLFRNRIKHSIIPLTLASLGMLTAVTYHTNSAYLFTLFIGLGASAELGIAYSALVIGKVNTPQSLKYFTNLRISINPETVANYLTITLVSTVSTLIFSEAFGRGYATITGFLTPIGLYAFFKVIKNKYALLTAYFVGAAITWLALTNAGVQTLNNWIMFFNEVIYNWGRSAF